MAKTAKRKTPKLPAHWPAANPEARYTADLVPAARNARTHTKAQVQEVANSITEWGWTNAVLVDPADNIIAGHGRILAAALLGIEAVPVVIAKGWSDAQIRAYLIADNQLAAKAGWDTEILGLEMTDLVALDFDVGLIGFEAEEVQSLLFPEDGNALAHEDNAELPPLEAVIVSQPGDLWILGDHRVLCGDSTRPDDVARLMDDVALNEETAVAACVFADPPYGMGKERDGVLNDNLYREKLDAFQMAWWTVAREHLGENGSLYIWGNAPDLWRLWYTGGLSLAGDLMVRNEIVWDKVNIPGMKSDLGHSYPIASERCLFLMRGQQFIGNQNKDDYWPGWEPLRTWLIAERKRAGWKVSDVNKATGTSMGGHWFGKSQFQPIGEEHYAALQEAADGVAFVEDYAELFARLFPDLLKQGEDHRRSISDKVRESRSYFDNGHDAMTDVWRFGRVIGEERFGHATPKPVSMVGRAIMSSTPEHGLILDPFLGTGTSLIASELLGRTCYALELEPAYVDVSVRRWQERAGQVARLDGDGRTFDEIAGAGR